MSATISDRSVVVAAKDQVSCDLAGEAAILNIKSGVYYGLDPVGARIWSLVQEPRKVAGNSERDHRRIRSGAGTLRARSGRPSREASCRRLDRSEGWIGNLNGLSVLPASLRCKKIRDEADFPEPKKAAV